MDRLVTESLLDRFARELLQQEKSPSTVAKYLRDVRAFQRFAAGGRVDKDLVLRYKRQLQQGYATASANSMLVALGCFFHFLGWEDCRVRLFKCQRRVFRDRARELSREEYLRLVAAARRRGDARLALLLQALCSTGIRVSEHRFITAEAARTGRARVCNKGKERLVLLPRELCRALRDYCRAQGIRSGAVFVTRGGNPLDRSNIWAMMKALCRAAGVEPGKVFPHNLRHLFAVSYYALDKDVVRLADLLGHASIDTTRIYIATSGDEQARRLSRLRLIA